MTEEQLNEIMSIDIDNLTRRQYDSYRLYIVKVMEKITDDIRNERYENIKLIESPAGDSYGCDNDIIDFNAYGCLAADAGEVIDELKRLQKRCED